MCATSEGAGEIPTEIPPSSFAPFAAQYGMPDVAPVTSTAFWRTISRPTSSASAKAFSEQCADSAAPDTQILYFRDDAVFSILLQYHSTLLFEFKRIADLDGNRLKGESVL